MKMTRILTVIIVTMILIIVAGCGSNSPTSPATGTVVVNGKTAFVNMAVNFPPRTTATGLISPLISVNTTKVNITLFASGTNQILGSSLILAPASGGIASTSIPINGYAGPIYIDIKGYDSANALTGYIRQNNVTITAGSITNVSATMVEFNQGVTVTGYTLLTPDNTALTLNNIYLAPDPNSHYFMGIKVTNASTAAVGYLNNTFNALDWASKSSVPMISDGLATFTIDIPNASGTIWHKYDFTLNFASGGNTPLVSVTSRGLRDNISNPAPVSNIPLYATVYTGTQYAVVGASGSILTSPDTINWTSRTSGTTNNLHSIVWSGTQFVAVGDAGTITTSPDGITWTLRTSSTANALFSVAWSGTQFAVVGDIGTILTSPDGITWTTQVPPITYSFKHVIWAGTQFVSVGSPGVVMTSSTGATWTAQYYTGDPLSCIAWSGTKYVAPGNNISWGTVYTSSDAVTWTFTYYSLYQTINNIIWTGTQFAAVNNTGYVLTSVDGITWASYYTGIYTPINNIIWTGTQYVIVNNAGDVMTSPNGITWTIPIHPMPGAANLNLNLAWNNTIAPPPANVPVTVF